MSFREEAKKILVDLQTSAKDGRKFEVELVKERKAALTSIINLVDKDIIGEDIESDHQMSHRQGKTEQRNKLKEKEL